MSDDTALRPLLRWAEPMLAPMRERALAQWASAARRHPDRFDFDPLRLAIMDAFAEPALSWSCRTLLLELAIARHQQALQGETPAQRFEHFLEWIDSAAGRRALDAGYPLLRADIARLATQTEHFLARLLRHLIDDHSRLAPLFADADTPGRLCAFETGLGDRHDHGGSVVRLRFEAGRMLYKPRRLAMDVAYARFLAELAEQGVEPLQKAAATLDRGEYGYAQWIEHVPLIDLDAAAVYYRRYGGLVAIAYLLSCTDLHLENVIACGDHPVLIDLETVFQPWLSRRGPVTGHYPPHAPSILFSGLLPFERNDPDAYDMSGLAWGEHRRTVRRATGEGTDQLRLAPVETMTQPSANLPFLADGTRIAPHAHADAMVSGFEDTYRGLLMLKPRLCEEGGPLAPFAGLETRALVRSTHIYARLLGAMSHPQYLRSEAERDAVLSRLEVGSREWPFLARTQAIEREVLLCGDVPRFRVRVDGIDVRDGDGHAVPGLFVRSGWKETQRRLRALSPRDLERQRYAIRQSLESIRPSVATEKKTANPHQTHPSPHADHRIFLDTAMEIGDALLQLSFRDRGEIVFFQPEYRNNPQPVIAPMGASLYEGLAGMALLFGELGAQSGLTRFTRAADAALESSRRILRDDPKAMTAIGPYTGLSGWLYVLLAAGVRWRRPDLIDEAAEWLPRIAERIADDDELDLIGGAGGCLLVLSEMQRCRPGADVTAAMTACAMRLVETTQRDADGAHWPCPAASGRRLSGFAHGSAGIGAALACHAHVQGDARCHALAMEALRYERAAYEARGRRWYDLDDGPDEDGRGDTYSWCHGAPGVGLARLLWPESSRDAAWHEETLRCVEKTLAEGFAGGHCLCHGQFGNLELPLQWAIQARDAAMLGRCRALGHGLIEQSRDAGWRCGGRSIAELPLGLMVGLAGIAYGCLRLADPWHVPSALSLSLGAAST